MGILYKTESVCIVRLGRNKTLFIHVQVDQICGWLSSFPGEICPLIRVGVFLLQDSFMLFRADGMTLCISNELKQEYQRSQMLQMNYPWRVAITLSTRHGC